MGEDEQRGDVRRDDTVAAGAATGVRRENEMFAPATQEIRAVHARAYAAGEARPTGAAAAPAPPSIPLAPVKRMQARFNPLADGMVYLVVFLGGCVGTAMRYGLALLIPQPAASEGPLSAFHTATFLANMIACLIFAWLTTYVSQASWLPKRARQLTSRGVGMGMCGGFSTLSAMVIEELTSIQGAQIGGFVFYMLASYIGGLIVAALGVKLALIMSAKDEAKVVLEAVSGKHAAPANPAPIPVGAGSGPSNRSDTHDLYSGFVDVSVSAPPQGDYGQPFAASSAASVSSVAPVESIAPVAIEPAPITDEIPLVGDLTTGEVSDATELAGSRAAADGSDDIPAIGDVPGEEVSR